jgi:hypothetical protein
LEDVRGRVILLGSMLIIEACHESIAYPNFDIVLPSVQIQRYSLGLKLCNRLAFEELGILDNQRDTRPDSTLNADTWLLLKRAEILHPVNYIIGHKVFNLLFLPPGPNPDHSF